MIEIDGKYFLLEDTDLKDGHKVKREKDNRNVWRCRCPRCSDSRQLEHRKQQCMAVYPDEGWAYCHNCGNWFWTKEYYDKEIAPKRGRKNTNVAEKTIDLSQLRDDYPQELIDYFEKERKLSVDMVRRMGIKWIPRTIDGKQEIMIAYPTFDGAKCINVHYRALHKENGFSQETGCDPIPWNVNSVVGHDTMIITEGRNDALACIQAGYEAVISLGNGAKSRTDLFDGFRHTLFAQVKTVIIAVDNDDAGDAARDNLLKYFGAARCRVVQWRNCKDANDMLKLGGVEAVRACIEAAEESPIPGYVPTEEWQTGVRWYYEQGGIPNGLTIDLEQLASLEKLEKGYFGVTSGFPGSGKSTFTLFKCLSMAVEHSWRICLYSPEKFPYKLLFHELATMLIGRRLTLEQVDEGTFCQAMEFLRNHFYIIDANRCKGIDDILEAARQIGMRYQIDMTVIDPANWVDQTQARGGDPLERANYVIGQVVDFAQVENQLTWMVAHPRKPPLMKDGKAYVPEMWDIAGTSDYANKATWVEIIERDFAQERTIIHIKKVRFGHLGKVGECCVRMDDENHRFVGYNEVKANGGVVQYKFQTSDKSNWLISKAIQQTINW
jgi:twinkle protein